MDNWETEHGLSSDWEEVPHDLMESDNRTVYASNIQSMSYTRPPPDPSLSASATGLMTSAAASFVSLFNRGHSNTKKN